MITAAAVEHPAAAASGEPTTAGDTPRISVAPGWPNRYRIDTFCAYGGGMQGCTTGSMSLDSAPLRRSAPAQRPFSATQYGEAG